MGKRQKYDYSFKLRSVNFIVKDHRSIESVAWEYGFPKSCLQLWLSFYKAYGSEGLKKHRNRHYDVSFKLLVLTTIDQEHLSLREACARFNIASPSVIGRWKRGYKLNGLTDLATKARGRPKKMNMSSIKRKPRKSNKPLTREEELLLKIEALEAENELLKKLQALTQARKRQKP